MHEEFTYSEMHQIEHLSDDSFSFESLDDKYSLDDTEELRDVPMDRIEHSSVVSVSLA